MTEYDGESDLLGQANALMHRYQGFIAHPAEASVARETAPDAPDADAEDDLPVLTEVVHMDAASLADAPAPLDALRTELESALSDWLAKALPSAFANASQQLLAELEDKARQSLLPLLRERLEARRLQAKR